MKADATFNKSVKTPSDLHSSSLLRRNREMVSFECFSTSAFQDEVSSRKLVILSNKVQTFARQRNDNTRKGLIRAHPSIHFQNKFSASNSIISF